jgi:pyridoxamine 5'-phosphate oxidase family protein
VRGPSAASSSTITSWPGVQTELGQQVGGMRRVPDRDQPDRAVLAAACSMSTESSALLQILLLRQPSPYRYAHKEIRRSMSMSHFTERELAYLRNQGRLGHVATVGPAGTPHVVPVDWTFNEELDTIDIAGIELETTRKYLDVARSGRAAFVVDDVIEDPFTVRGIEVRGRAEAVAEPRPLIRIQPRRIVSWGLESQELRVFHARTVQP